VEDKMLDNGLDKKVLKQAVEKWGMDLQLLILIEECAELILAITKHDNDHENIHRFAEIIKTVMKKERNFLINSKSPKKGKIYHGDNICEEAADVSIMLAQLFTMFENNEKYNFKKNFTNYQLMKIKRLKERLRKAI
jgi:NTP pyrophosphatase (non-canonical NTP hydrolase)